MPGAANVARAGVAGNVALTIFARRRAIIIVMKDAKTVTLLVAMGVTLGAQKTD